MSEFHLVPLAVFAGYFLPRGWLWAHYSLMAVSLFGLGVYWMPRDGWNWKVGIVAVAVVLGGCVAALASWREYRGLPFSAKPSGEENV